MSNEFKIGDVVQCGVYVGYEYLPTFKGRVVQLHSEYATVDIGPMGDPWHVFYTYVALRHAEPRENRKTALWERG